MSDIPIFRFKAPNDSDFPFEILRIEENEFLSKEAKSIRRDHFYAAFWITAGKGKYFIDFKEYEIRPKSLFLINPGQVHYWTSLNPIGGYAIPFQAELFHLYGNYNLFEKLSLFRAIGGTSAFYPSEADISYFNQHFDQLFAEYHTEKFGRKELILSLFQMLLIQIQRKAPAIHKESYPKKASDRLTQEFLTLLEDKVSQEHKLQSYADALGVTPGHLTETIKAVMGQPGGKLLQQRLALEAKRWLAHSDLTIEQISDKLNFEDPSYFGRFFKREVGETPGQFRGGFRESYQAIS